MVRVFRVNNPYNVQDGIECREYDEGQTLDVIGEPYAEKPWLCVAYLEGKRFFPTRSEWKDIKLKTGDCVYFMPHVGGPVTIVFIAIVAIAAIVVALSIQPPSVAATPEADPVFDLKGQKNQVRLGSPIEDGYGRVRLWPSYAARAYNQYFGNDQFQFQLFCVGQGSWDIEEIFIEDTPIDQFDEVTVETYQPGEQVTLFPNNVETSAEVGIIELFGPNEDEYSGVTGPFTANAVNTFTDQLEVDVSLSQGLYESNDDGGLDPVTVTAKFEYREIRTDTPENSNPFYNEYVEKRYKIQGDTGGNWVPISSTTVYEDHAFADGETEVVDEYEVNLGGIIGTLFVEVHRVRRIYFQNSGATWQTLADFTKTLSTVTPNRFTLTKTVPSGRYEVRGYRTNNASTSHLVGDTLQWVGLRAFLPSTKTFGDVTMLAIKARSTNNLNDTASNRINLFATRKLPVYDTVTETIPAVDDLDNRTATRSPIWAMVNILRANYGGALDDQFLDFDFLSSEATIAENESIYFDWIYDQRGTVWEAIKLPCFVNRSIPMLNGSRVSFVRDQVQTLPTFFINPENTLQGSFRLEKKLFDLHENDGLQVEYTDPDTWKPEIVLCLLPGQVGNNPKRIKLQGVTDRQRAYDLGMYLWFKESNEREQVTVRTGLEGYIPTYGDLGRFGSDIPRWGFNGFVKSIVGNLVTLSENVEFTEGEVHQLAIRGKTGQDLGPYTVTEGDELNEVLIVGSLPEDQFFFDYQNEPPYFTFGISDFVGRVCRVVNITPEDSDAVTIKAIVDDQGRHANFGTAPSINVEATPPNVPDNPVVSNISVLPVLDSETLVTVSWEPAFGARYYVLQTSNDGVEWLEIDTVIQTNYSLPVVTGNLYIRVAAVNVGAGPFASWFGPVGALHSLTDDTGNFLTDDTGNFLTG